MPMLGMSQTEQQIELRSDAQESKLLSQGLS